MRHYNEKLEMPATLRLLGICKGKKILDLGCGPGLYAKVLQEKGAMVKGIDISEEAIKIAKKESPKSEFKVGSAENLPYKNSEFDIVLSSLVLGHIENWKRTLLEVKRVLKKRGLFIFSIYNPVTEQLRKTLWFFRTFAQITDYFKEGWRFADWDEKIKVYHHHKTYGTIIKLLIANGFEIIDYEDCKPSQSTKEKFPKEYKRTIDAPLFCVWKTRKK